MEHLNKLMEIYVKIVTIRALTAQKFISEQSDYSLIFRRKYRI